MPNKKENLNEIKNVVDLNDVWNNIIFVFINEKKNISIVLFRN